MSEAVTADPRVAVLEQRVTALERTRESEQAQLLTHLTRLEDDVRYIRDRLWWVLGALAAGGPAVGAAVAQMVP